MSILGLGDPDALINVYIANRPAYNFIGMPNTVKHLPLQVLPLQENDIYQCGQACGNGWRKVFNVYAKLVFAYGSTILLPACKREDIISWQHYRDNILLQKNSKTALLFSKPNFEHKKGQKLHLVMGKTYANSLGLPKSLHWVNNDFAIDKLNRMIVCPYFDYRQLSNAKILFLVDLMNEIGFE